MTFDSDDNIWLANNPTTSDLVIMNKKQENGSIIMVTKRIIIPILKKIDDLATFKLLPLFLQ
jgi:hypothetical protein